MAWKKRKIAKSEEEQLYMLEILIDRIDLCPEKSVDKREGDLIARVGLADLTPVDIVVVEFIKAANRSENKEDRSGKSCLFVRTPSNLIRSIKSTPLSVEVYRVARSREDRNSRPDDGQILFCAATAFLPGCFCDRVAAAKDKIDGLPSPYTLKKICTLTDERGSPCGSVSIHLRLSCFGSSITDHFALREKSYMFPGFPPGDKFRRARSPEEDAASDGAYRAESRDNALLPHEIADNAYPESCNQQIRAAVSAVLTRPRSPPRVSMDQPGFEKLTSAEKLNDRKYRNMIYETYPDEPTCSCLPTDRSTHPLVCRSGCMRACCMGLRNPDILRNGSMDDTSLAVPTHRLDDPHLKPRAHKREADYYDPTRMRGGCDRDDICSNDAILRNASASIWRGDNINLKQHRQAGGSEYARAPTGAATTVIYQKGRELGTTFDAIAPRPRTADAIKADCICPGANTSYRRTSTSQCVKKPCTCADCMMRSFKGAQDFVDSLGKVPGVAGLGLMDPSESPYFRSTIDRDYAVRETSGERKRCYPAIAPAIVQCTGPCNVQFGKPGVISPFVPPYVAMPGRGPGFVREAIPTLPDATLVPVAVKPKKKEDKKEEKSEKQKEQDVTIAVPLDEDVGPCGEPKCKSRRKTAPGNERAQTEGTEPREAAEESRGRVPVHSMKPPSTIARGKIGRHRERGRRARSKPGPAGDRVAGRGAPVKVSKRVMRYVYSIGDFYPGISFGHKNCVDPRLRVPANMGWLWNTSDTVGKLKPRIGWKPGAIGRYLNELLKEAKMGSLEEDSRPRSVPSRTTGRRGRLYKTMSYAPVKKLQAKKEGEAEAEAPPTLHIHRKEGAYYVTMYPIKRDTADAPQLEEPTKPLQFKIARNRDDASVASSSTASDMEIEFSPPAAVNRYRRKPDVVHADTQVRQQEILDALKPAEAPKRKERGAKKERRERKK